MYLVILFKDVTCNIWEYAPLSGHGDSLSWLCLCGWGLPEQSALHWVTLFNSAVHTDRGTFTRAQPHTARGARHVNTHSCTHMLAVKHAADTQHGRANTLKREHPEAEDIFCHWCLSTDINHRQGKCLCALLMLYTGYLFCSRIMSLCCIYITTAYCIHHPSGMCSSPHLGKE